MWMSEQEDEPARGLFEPLTPGEEIIEAIGNDDANRAAQLLRQADCIGQPALGMIADLLDGSPKKDPHLSRLYPYRLVVASWVIVGRSNEKAVAEATKQVDRYMSRLFLPSAAG